MSEQARSMGGAWPHLVSDICPLQRMGLAKQALLKGWMINGNSEAVTSGQIVQALTLIDTGLGGAL